MWRKPLLLGIPVIRFMLHADSTSMPAGGKRGREGEADAAGEGKERGFRLIRLLWREDF
jgi:hypothetical protein